ncbi:hypothetical protein ABPG74_018776 [Tetrahymena malaccensis]
MNNILRSDFNEYIQNRNNAKIQFLQHEINQYQNFNQQLKDILQMKKKSLEILNSKSNKKDNYQNGSTPQKYQEDREKVLEQLFKENQQLLASFKIVNQERNNAQSKVLISQQVAEEMENFQQDIIQEQEDQLLELRRIVQDKEYTIQEFEKQKSQLGPAGVIIKYRDIVTPTEQLSKLQNLNESYNNAVQILKKQNEYLNEINKKYEIENEFASFELIKLKSAMRNPSNIYSIKQSLALKVNQNKEYEDLVFTPKLNDNQKVQQEQKLRSKIFKVPQQSNSQQPQQINKKKIDEEWDRARKSFDKELINERVLSDQITQLEAYNQQLLLTNDQILNSNQIHQTQIEKLQQNINFYKEYHKKIVKLQSKIKSNKINQQQPINLITSSNSFNDISFTKILKQIPQSTKSKGQNNNNKYQQGQKKQEAQTNENSKIRTKTKLDTILNNSVDHMNIPTLNDEEDAEPEWNVRECKVFLKNLADEFYKSLQNSKHMILSRRVITKIKQNGGIGYQMQQKRITRIRSISNILEYKRDKKNDEFYLQNKKDFSQQFSKHPQTHYVNTENDEYIPEYKDVILEHIKSKNSQNQNNYINHSNNNSSTNNQTAQQPNGAKNLDQFGANSIQIQNSQVMSNHNLQYNQAQILEARNVANLEKNQPGDISTYLENGVDVSYELRNKQVAGNEQNGGVYNINGTNYFHNNSTQIGQHNVQGINVKQFTSQELRQSIISKKGTFISTHSPSYVPNANANGKKQLYALGTMKQKQSQYNNNDDQQSFISNDDILNNQILTSQIDIKINTQTQQDEK